MRDDQTSVHNIPVATRSGDHDVLDASNWARLSRFLTFGVRHPRVALTSWVAVISVLAVIGLGVGHSLSGANLLIPGSESAREAQLLNQEFGQDVSAPILLSGPSAALNTQGPQLAARLGKLSGAEVVSAWNGGSLGRGLRRSATQALVLVAVTQHSGQTIGQLEQRVERVVHATVSAPVRAQVSGIDSIGAELQSSSLHAIHRAELIAIPVLLIVLLIVFGSPAAAAIPVVLGLGTVLSGFGLISLLGHELSLNVLATTAASMMGLALGVDYSLLVVARFRDELTDRKDPRDVRRAATVAALRAGRTATFAGGAIITLMLLALAVAAGTALLSAVVGVIVVALISVIGTVLATPAALMLVGHRIRRHGVEHTALAGAAGGAWVARISRSVPIVAVSLFALLAVGSNALALATGPPSAKQLPTASTAAKDYALISHRVGAGWVTPFELLIVAHSGAITTLPRLDALAATQAQIARDPDVASVVGPAELAKRAAPLATAESSVHSANNSLKRSSQVIGGLNGDLGQAAAGAKGVESGFSQATAAVERLANGGSSSAAVGALEAGLARAAAGSSTIGDGLGQASGAAGRIAASSESIAAGADGLVASLRSSSSSTGSTGSQISSLANALGDDASNLSRVSTSVADLGRNGNAGGASSELSAALSALNSMRIGKLDPSYRAAVADVAAAEADLPSAASASQLADEIQADASGNAAASNGLHALASQVTRLSNTDAQLEQSASNLPTEIASLENGERALAAGIQHLAASEASMTQGLGSLSGGTASLSSKLEALQSGAAAVASGLSGEQGRAAALNDALSSGSNKSKGSSTGSTNAPVLGQLAHNPGFFDSGYVVLAALEGSSAAQHAGIDFLVNVANNGQAARMMIVPRSGVRSPATAALRQRLQRIARQLSAKTGAEVLIGGPAAQLIDYSGAANARLPLLVAVLMLATFILLVVVFRSLLAALVGVLLNLLSVGAAFGILSMLTGGNHPVLGGPGYVDALSVSAMFAIVFALSLDYQVFLLMRMREGWLRTGSTNAGVDYGVARTARVVAGAAAIMAGAFLAFASSDVATIRQLGVGLAVAIVIDATVVRLVLLPAALRAGGRFTWWLPAWLERRLPVIDIGTERRDGSRQPLPESYEVAETRKLHEVHEVQPVVVEREVRPVVVEREVRPVVVEREAYPPVVARKERKPRKAPKPRRSEVAVSEPRRKRETRRQNETGRVAAARAPREDDVAARQARDARQARELLELREGRTGRESDSRNSGAPQRAIVR
jgi:RND superfamily putative drug exporter